MTAYPEDCGAPDDVWTPCPGCPQEAACQPCACSGVPCCIRHRDEGLVEDDE